MPSLTASIYRQVTPTQRKLAPRFNGLRVSMGVLLTVFAAGVVAQPVDTPQKRYVEQRAVCLKGESNQDQATCLKEAGAALNEARRVKADVAPEDYSANKTKRCNTLPADQKEDCLRRMRGDGVANGTAASGGIYRELETQVPAAPTPKQ